MASSSPPVAAARFVRKILVIAELELRKIRHDYSDLIARAIQPALWLLFFGQVFTRARLIQTGDLPYLDFITPGILAQSVLFVAIFYGIGLIWERDLGVTHRILASPTPRAALVIGKAASAGIRSLSQAIVVYLLALCLGVRLNAGILSLAGVLTVIFLGAALFSTLSLVVACLVKTRERFMGIGQLLTMPLFFGSNAIYPITIMPRWLRLISRINPLSYQVDALRALMIKTAPASFGVGFDFCVLIAITSLLVIVAARLYPRVVL